MPSREEMIAQLMAQPSPALGTAAPDIPPVGEASPETDGLDFYREQPWYKDLAEGMGLSAAETVFGIKELLGGEVSPENKAVLKMWRDQVDKSGGWGTTGRVTGEMAQLAIPGSQTAKLTKLPRFGRTLATTAGIGTAAGYGATKLPDEELGETRGGNAALYGGGALLGTGLAAAGSKMIRGLAKSDAAQRLLQKGLALTPAQMSAGGLPKALEYVMSFTPFLAKGTKRQQQKSVESFNKMLLDEAAPDGKQVTNIGHQGIRELRSMFNEAYDKAWEQAKPPPQATQQALGRAIAYMQRNMGADAVAPSRALAFDLDNMIRQGITPQAMKQFDNALRKMINQQGSRKDVNPTLLNYMKEMRNIFRASTGKAANDALQAVDAKYGNYLVAKDAARRSGALKEGGVFTPEEALSASARIGKGRAALDEAPMQSTIRDAQNVMATDTRAPIVDWLKGVARAIGPNAEPVFEATGRTLMGQSAPQRAAQETILPVARALREMGLSPENISATLVADKDSSDFRETQR